MCRMPRRHLVADTIEVYDNTASAYAKLDKGQSPLAPTNQRDDIESLSFQFSEQNLASGWWKKVVHGLELGKHFCQMQCVPSASLVDGSVSKDMGEPLAFKGR